jgi:hypothetical protein
MTKTDIQIRKYYLLLFFSVCVALEVTPQVIQGKVIDEAGKGFQHVSVILQKPESDQIISYTFTNESGSYTLSYQATVDSLVLKIFSLTIETQAAIIPNKTQTRNFVAKENVRELKEVFIKAPRMWGERDTINYLVESFRTGNDLVIGDVLKKLPGIDVKESGEILYRGKPVNKFYIENMDLLQGRYGIATQSISVDDISTVQILENHQPVKVLENIRFSDAAAINLKIKEKAKGIFSIMAKLGLGGFPVVWDNSLTGTCFARKKQQLGAYKTTNSGLDLAKEITSFTSPIHFSGDEMIYLRTPVPPSINKNRYLYNNAHLLTVNNLFKVKEQDELNVNLFYYNDHEKRSSYARSSYLLPDNGLNVIVEDLSSGYDTEKLGAEIRYNRNETMLYFNNYTHFSGNWERGRAHIITDRLVDQQLWNPSLQALNTLHWVKKGGDEKGLEIMSDFGYKTSPQRLTVQPQIYPRLFDENTDWTGARQQVRLNTLRFDNRLSALSVFRIGHVNVNPQIRFNLYDQQMNSSLSPMNREKTNGDVADSLRNRFNWSKYSANVSAGLSYQSKRFRANLNIPVGYHLIRYKDRIQAKETNLSRIYFQPNVFLRYNPNSKYEIKANYRFYNGTGNLQSLYSGYILQDYRVLNRYNGLLAEFYGNGGDADIAYKNVFALFFTQIGIRYNYQKNNLLEERRFEGIFSESSMTERPNASEYVSLNASFSKGFDWKKFFVKVNADYVTQQGELLQQEEVMNYRGNARTMELVMNMEITRRILVTYKGLYGENRVKIKQTEPLPVIRSLVNRLTLGVPLLKYCNLNFSYEHYYNNRAIGNKNFSLVDLGLNYVFNRLSYTLNWNNILNTQRYISDYYDGFNSFYTAYDIRSSTILATVTFKLK